MNGVFPQIARLVTVRPRLTLAALFALVAVLAGSTTLTVDQAGNEAFLPDDSDVSDALVTLQTTFPDSAGLSAVTIIHRGDVLTPEGLAQIDAVLAAVTGDADVAARLALSDPVAAISPIYRRALQTDDLSTASQQEIDAASAALSQDPVAGEALDALLGEADGTGLAITSVKLRSLDDRDGLADVELAVAELVPQVPGPLQISSLSSATIDQESAESSSGSMTILLLVAFAVIVLLLFLFFRTGSDVLLALVGLGLTVIGTLGFQGLAGPGGLGLIGPPNQLTTMVPIMLVGLVVDYAIQLVARYRELRLGGSRVGEAAMEGLTSVALPLGLAAGTTIASFLTNLISPIPANRDFGAVAAFGVFFGIFVMLTLVPAVRSIVDGRAEARGSLSSPRPISDAIPGAGRVAERIGVLVSARPGAMLVGTGAVTLGLFVAALGIVTEFDSTDFLPQDGDSITDITALDEALGGQTEPATILVEAELTDDRTLRNLLDVNAAFEDERTRPAGAAGSITLSLGGLLADALEDSGQPDDLYDPELESLIAAADQGLTVDAAAAQEVLDRLEALDPVTFSQVASVDPDGPDKALLQFTALTGDQERTRTMVADIEGIWFGDRDQITATSGEITSVEVTDVMAESQTAAIGLTVLAALIVLVIFFAVTSFRPILAVIAVFPILLVLVWVLGTMRLLGIPYNVVTALITALSIGIGVDYTLHVIHRFTEELDHGASVTRATTTTLTTTGSALMGSALTTALGFGVLLFSPLIPFQQFGLVTAITILYSLAVSLVVVPPLLVVWAAYQQWHRRHILEGNEWTTTGLPEASASRSTT